MPLLLAIPIVMSLNIQASVTVTGTCGITHSSGDLNFGSLAEDTTSSTKTVGITNTGNIDTTEYQVSGTGWTGGIYSFGVGQTEYDDGGWTALSGTLTTIGDGVLSPDMEETTDFRVNIPDGQESALYQQTVTFTASCG